MSSFLQRTECFPVPPQAGLHGRLRYGQGVFRVHLHGGSHVGMLPHSFVTKSRPLVFHATVLLEIRRLKAFSDPRPPLFRADSFRFGQGAGASESPRRGPLLRKTSSDVEHLVITTLFSTKTRLELVEAVIVVRPQSSARSPFQRLGIGTRCSSTGAMTDIPAA